jgi:hypothetical protein
VFDQFLDPGFMNAFAAAIGPLVVFVAPTEEIEAMIFDADSYAGDGGEDDLSSGEIGFGMAEPTQPSGHREAA